MNEPCPLCGGENAGLYHHDGRREYLRCGVCSLVFVPSRFRLGPEEEKAEYDRHENDPADPRYRRFLAQLFEPVAAALPPGACGIDYGCGPGPALAQLFADAGFFCANYDPFYAADPAVLEREYDFLVCSETIEHCHRPDEVFERFFKLVKPGGTVGIMTQMVIDQAAFSTWRYTADPTHVCFFSRTTFEWVSRRHGCRVKFHGKSVTLFFV